MSLVDCLSALNDKQRLAVNHTFGPALVLAGAGSGKTRVLTTRVVNLLEQGLAKPENILLVTFTNKAAEEMRKRVQDLIKLPLPMVGTFHSLATKMLRRFAPSIKLDYNFTIYDSDDQLALLKDLYKVNLWDQKTYKPQAVKAAISEAKNHLLTPEDYAQTVYSTYGEFVSQAYKAYQQALLAEQALDFDDLLNYALRLLQQDAFARRFYQEQLKFILIDEYQDTNTAQYQLSKILAAPENNLFVVGDFSQSIYAWRGADYKNMLALQKDYAQLTTYHLDQNYRSIQPILTVATQIISKNTTHPVLNLWTDNKTKALLTVFDCETGELEAASVASEINQLQRDYKLADIAILYRTNAQSRSFEEALSRLGIPYKLIGGFKFYERKEIKDALCYLRLFVNSQESVSLQRAKKIGKRRYDKYVSWRQQYLEKNHSDPGLQDPATILAAILQATSYRQLYDQNEIEEAAKLENLAELLAYAKQFNTINSFLENIALVQDEVDLNGHRWRESNRDEISLMSLHSAKGLEFAVVFMVGMEDNLLPHSRSLYDSEQLAEERRLCYVGITRAKEKLYFTHARRRWSYSGMINCCRSCFLDDVNAQLLDIQFKQADLPADSCFPPAKRQQRFSSPLPSGRYLDLQDTQLDEFLSNQMSAQDLLRRH